MTTVPVRACACPGTPHDRDEVYLLPEIGLEGGLVAEQQLIDHSGDASLLTRLWATTFVRYGATGWNLTDEEGDPVPFDVDALLASYEMGRAVADAASDLYTQQVMRPLMKALPNTSPAGRTGRTTSRRQRSTGRQRESSSPATSEVSPPSAA